MNFNRKLDLLPMRPMRSLFLFDPLDMNAEVVGGVQLCSQEFLKIIKTASNSIDYLEVNICRELSWRIRRKLNFGAYLLYNPNEVRSKLLAKKNKCQPTHIFLNKSELIRLTPLLRDIFPESKIGLMSHGNQSGDDLYEISGIQGSRNKGLRKFIAVSKIGQDLVTESWFRHRYVDFVCVMSEEESALERWMGSKKTIVMPRTITNKTLSWNPKISRVGFVGTLNHTPNKVALNLICEKIADQALLKSINIELRVVGKPEFEGVNLAGKYNFVKYLGALNDEDLESEISSWNLFLNPIFWLSKGASMKLGQAISWGIPFVTTESGKRGYELTGAELLITSDNTQDFVARIMNLMSDEQNIIEAKNVVTSIQANSPTINSLADIIVNILCE
jgi:glycosyltransferase involved in cell wall biosynthesis